MARGNVPERGAGLGEACLRLTENRFIRDAPSAAGAVLGVAKRGDALPLGGHTTPQGWRLVLYRGRWGWVRTCS